MSIASPSTTCARHYEQISSHPALHIYPSPTFPSLPRFPPSLDFWAMTIDTSHDTATLRSLNSVLSLFLVTNNFPLHNFLYVRLSVDAHIHSFRTSPSSTRTLREQSLYISRPSYSSRRVSRSTLSVSFIFRSSFCCDLLSLSDSSPRLRTFGLPATTASHHYGGNHCPHALSRILARLFPYGSTPTATVALDAENHQHR